jgi:pilus assembly protein CpaC
MFDVFAGEPQMSRLRFYQRTTKPTLRRRLWTLVGCSAFAACGTLSAARGQDRPEVPPAPAPAAGRLPDQISSMPAITQTLDVVQHRSQLIVGRSNVTRSAIADPSIIEVAQYSPNELAIIGLQVGTTTLTLWFDKNPEPLIYLVNTIRDPSVDERRRSDFVRLERKLALLFPNSKVALIPFSGKIVVKGQAHDAEEAARILQIIHGEVGIPQSGTSGQSHTAACANGSPAGKPAAESQDTIVNMLEIPGEFQVMLRVRIAELDRSELRRMGVDLTHLLFDDRHWASGGRGRSTSAGIFENREIRAVMNGLMANGTAKILSEPVLTVISGHSASFLSGGEFAVPNVVGVDGLAGKQTSFHNFGTSLVVTPQVLDHDLIRMNIVPEFSQLNAGNTVDGIPGIDTRRAETTVQLREGQTIVLAGLISHKTVTETSHVRFLGDLPIVGQKYFSGKRSKQDESELLILVTPELVRPMDADEVPPVPGHEVTAPNDCELFHCGMTEGTPDPTVYQVPPFGAGHSAGVPTGYHLFEQQAGPAVGPRSAGVPVPVPAPPVTVSRFTPSRVAQMPIIQQASGQQPIYIQQPPVQQAYVQQSPPPVQPPVVQRPLVQQSSLPQTAEQADPFEQSQPSTEKAPAYPQPSLPVNPGLDAPEPVIAPVTPVNTANGNSPVSGSGPIRQTTDWFPAPQSTPAPVSAATPSATTLSATRQSAIPQPAAPPSAPQPTVTPTPAPQTPAPWSTAPWFHARQTPAPQPPAAQQPAAQKAAPPKPAAKPAAEPLPNWSDRPIHSFGAAPVVPPSHNPDDGPTIIPGALPAASAAGAAGSTSR